MKAIYSSLMLAITGFFAVGVVHAADPGALAKSKSCMACHAVDKKIVGPAFKDVAKKYAGDKTAEAKLADKVKKGSSGAWGSVPMPPNNVSKEEATTLVKWILGTK